MSDILSARGVTKSFGKLVAVNDLSFDVQEGEIFGIAGPNGSGKSTLFNVLTRIPFGPDGGEIRYRGERIERKPPHVICRLGVARTFQKETVFDSLSVFQNALMGSVYGQGRAAPSREAAEDALEFVGLSDKLSRPAEVLTVFEKKLLMLASAIATQPDLLLLDEPASSLTPPEIQQLTDLIGAVNARGVTVMVIEHVLPLLLSVSERLLVLNYGEKLVLGEPEDVIRDERVIEAYLGTRAKHPGAARA